MRGETMASITQSPKAPPPENEEPRVPSAVPLASWRRQLLAGWPQGSEALWDVPSSAGAEQQQALDRSILGSYSFGRGPSISPKASNRFLIIVFLAPTSNQGSKDCRRRQSLSHTRVLVILMWVCNSGWEVQHSVKPQSGCGQRHD